MRIPTWLKENPSALFIIAFIIEFSVAAFVLALGYEDLAYDFAEIAYYFLIIGVILQLIVLIYNGDKSERLKNNIFN